MIESLEQLARSDSKSGHLTKCLMLVMLCLIAFAPGISRLPPIDRDEFALHAGDEADGRVRRACRHPLSEPAALSAADRHLLAADAGRDRQRQGRRGAGVGVPDRFPDRRHHRGAGLLCRGPAPVRPRCRLHRGNCARRHLHAEFRGADRQDRRHGARRRRRHAGSARPCLSRRAPAARDLLDGAMAVLDSGQRRDHREGPDRPRARPSDGGRAVHL